MLVFCVELLFALQIDEVFDGVVGTDQDRHDLQCGGSDWGDKGVGVTWGRVGVLMVYHITRGSTSVNN